MTPAHYKAPIFLLYLGPFLTDQYKRESGCVEKEKVRRGTKEREMKGESENVAEQSLSKREEIGAQDKYFPSGPVAKTRRSQSRGPVFDPWSGN